MGKNVYVMKTTTKQLIKEKMSQNELAEKVGITRAYLNEIVNNHRKHGISKSLAYFIAKAIDPNLEIMDVFYITK